MKLLLKTLLQRRARDEGFTLPMVIALGLVMVLLGTANIVKSNEENLNATIQNSSSDAIAIAEVGISKYREFLNQNRILAVYNHDVWNSNEVDITVNGVSIPKVDVAGQTCIDMTGAPAGWTGTATKPNDTAAEASDKDTKDNDNWWEIRENIDGADGDEVIGEYRLVSYTYDNDDDLSTNDNGDFNNLADVNPDYPADTSNDNDTDDDGESDARGILKVQGRSPDGSVAQIQVDIPLRINQDEMQNLAPALWIGDGNGANLGTLTLPSFDPSVPNSFPSNIVLTDSASGCSDPDEITGIDSDLVISDGRSIPLLNPINAKFTEAGTANINTMGTLPNIIGIKAHNAFVTPPNGETFDQTVHCRDISNCKYYYEFTGSSIDAPLSTDGITKVVIHTDGDLAINEDILGSRVSSDYLEIYVEGNKAITIDSNSVNTVKALIHAPDSTLTISGTGTVNIIGSVWVNKFVNNATVDFGVLDGGDYKTENIRLKDSQTRVPTYEVYTTSATRPPRPLTSSPTNWVREEVE